MTYFEIPTMEPFLPTEWQTEDLNYLETREWSANWSEMGCYKTSSALWLIERKCEGIKNPRVLIVTSRAGKGTYYDAVPRTLPKWNLYSTEPRGDGKVNLMYFGTTLPMPVDTPFKEPCPEPTIILATYHAFANRSKLMEYLLSVSYDVVILDEAHRIKEKDNQWTRNLKRVKADVRHVMTGTGIINRPDEMWSLLNFCNKSVFPSYWAFRRTFCEEYRDEQSGFTKILGIKPEMLETFRNMRMTSGPRRVKNGPNGVFEGVLHEPIFTPYYVDLNVTQRKMFDEIKHYLYTLDQQGVPISSPNVLSQLNRLRQITVATPEKYDDYFDEKLQRRVQKIRLVEPSSKLDAVMDILDTMDDNQQVVIFSNFKDPLLLLEKRLEKAKPPIPYLHMKAEHNDDERAKLWLDTFPKGEHKVFMATLQLGSESINLTCADTAIFLDRSWSPKDNDQGVGRIYRPGQTKIPQIIHINARTTTDQRIEKLNETKKGWFNQIFGEDEE